MENHTIIEVQHLDSTVTNKSSLLDSIRDDCDDILKNTDMRTVGRYEEYGKYPDKEIRYQMQDSQIIVLSAIKTPKVNTILFVDGEKVDSYQNKYTEIEIKSNIQAKYNALQQNLSELRKVPYPYIEEYIEEQKDKIECELSVPMKNPIEDVSGGNLHVAKVSPGRIEVTIEAEDGRTLSKSKMTKKESFQLIRELEEEMNVYEYPSK